MADVSDVAEALASQVAAILALNGSGVTAITGNPVKIYAGWPDSATLQADLAIHTAHVSVFAKPLDTQDFVAMSDMGWVEQPNNGTTGTVERSVRRQTKVFAITVWADTFGARDALSAALDSSFAALSRIALPDGSNATLAYKGSLQRDEMQKVMIFRRDINYAATFDTVQSQSSTLVRRIDLNLESGNPFDLTEAYIPAPVWASDEPFTINGEAIKA